MKDRTKPETDQVRFGLIGHPLGHSFSADFFNAKFQKEGYSDYRYLNFDSEHPERDFPLLKADRRCRGFNVTIPYKKQIIPYLDACSPEAEAIGAVNVIKVGENGSWTGYNTDCTGFSLSLQPLLERLYHGTEGLQALVLGNGGASQAVQYALTGLEIPYGLVCRDKAKFVPRPGFAPTGIWTYGELSARMLASALLVVNTTNLGMFPHVDALPDIPYAAISRYHLAFDLIYNPDKTAFLAQCEQRGATIKNGLEMLHLQAEAAWRIWQEA